jgi:hypothetical protein
MGIRDIFDNAKKKAEERLNPKPLTPEEDRARKKANAEKQFNQLNKAINLVKKGIKIKGDVDKKSDAIKDGIARKTIDIAEKAAPIVDKIDEKLGRKEASKPAEQQPKDKPPKGPGIKDALGAAGRGLKDGAGTLGKTVKGAGKTIADGATDAGRAAAEKARAAKEAQERKPSTRSGLLDLIVPAVPETEATKPAASEKKPAAKKKPTRRPPPAA